MNRSTPYAAELARAEFAECRIERIFIRETLTEAIRFSDWRGGRFNPRALEIEEGELIVLLGDAVARGVFSLRFVAELNAVLDMLSAKHRRPVVTAVRKIERADLPSPYQSHILIEPVRGGYQASGATSAARQVLHLSSPIHSTYNAALRQAMAWSIEHGIPEIYVIGESDAHRT